MTSQKDYQNREIKQLQSLTICPGNSAFKQSFVDTGIKALLGDVIRVMVDPSASWQNGSGHLVNANGQNVEDGSYIKLSSPDLDFIKAKNLSFPDGAIVGTWDDGQTFIPIGQYCEFCITSELDDWKPAKDTTFKLAVWGNGAADTHNNSSHGNVLVFHGEGTQRYYQVQYNNPDFWIDSAKYNPDPQGGAFIIDAQVHSINDGNDSKGTRTLKETNIECKVGDILTVVIDFQDEWYITGNSVTNPCGCIKNRSGDHRSTLKNFEVNSFTYADGAVIGTFDTGDWEQRSYFPVGHYLKMTVLQDGKLTLMNWDKDNASNCGKMTAYVTTNNYKGFKGFHLDHQSLDLSGWDLSKAFHLDHQSLDSSAWDVPDEPELEKSYQIQTSSGYVLSVLKDIAGDEVDVLGSLPNEESEGQKWTITEEGVIKSNLGDFALDVVPKKQPDRQNVVLKAIDPSSPTQKWEIAANGQLKNKGNGLLVVLLERENGKPKYIVDALSPKKISNLSDQKFKSHEYTWQLN